MDEKPGSAATVAYCGICCSHCNCTLWWECSGCKAGGGFARCGVRLCATARGYATCAECGEMESCWFLNSLPRKVDDLVFCCRRVDNLREIRAEGLEAFVARRLGAR